MRRLLIIGGVFLVGALAFGLYTLKYEVQQLEDRYAAANRAILVEQEAIRILKAEWSFLNNPTRLSALVERHLDLSPVVADRMVTLGEIPMGADWGADRLPVKEAK